MPSTTQTNQALKDSKSPSRPQPRKAAPADDLASDDLQASLRVIKWINDTLDAAAHALGKDVTREAAVVVFILYKSDKPLSGKKLVKLYRQWTVSLHSPTVEESLRVAQGRLLRRGLVEVGSVGGTAVSKLEPDNLQAALWDVLENGVQSFKGIHLTRHGKKRLDEMRESINNQINGVLKELTPKQRKQFERLITETLPAPPGKPSTAEEEPASGD